MNQAKNATNSIGLKVISEYVLDVLKSNHAITVDDIYTQVHKTLSQTPAHQVVSLDAIKRRIYDVINIFHAAGIVDKQDKLIIFHMPQNSSPRTEEQQQTKIQFKEQLLLDQLFILNLFKSLVVRNSQMDEPEHINSLPAVIIGTQNLHETETTVSKDKTEVDFQTPELLTAMPCDEILKDLNIDIDVFKGFLKSSPEFEPYASFLMDHFTKPSLIDSIKRQTNDK